MIKDANDKALAKLSNEMKKLKHLILAVLLCASQMGTAQIFLDDEDMLKRSGAQNTEELIIPLHGVEYDQTDYVPIGGGTLLLAGMASAYLFSRKRKQNRRNRRTPSPMKKRMAFSMLFLIAPLFAVKVAAQAYYVIVPPTAATPYMCLNGTTYGATSTFDASTCVWEFDNGILKVGSYYLQGNKNNLSLVADISNATTFTISGTDITYFSDGKTRYVVYDNSFKGSDKNQKLARAFGATQGSHTNEVQPSGTVTTAVSMCSDTINNPTVYTQVASATLMNLGKYYFKGDMNGTYDGCPGYYEWSFTTPLSATFYVIDGSNQIVSQQPTPQNIASSITVGWSLSSDPKDQAGSSFLYLTPNSSTGELTIKNGRWGRFSADYYGWGSNNDNYHKGAPINVTLNYGVLVYGAPVGGASITLTIKAPTWRDYVNTKPSTFVADASGNFPITCREDLAWLINAVLYTDVGANMHFQNKTVYLTCDLDMGEYPWVPIGEHHYGFAGTFDGKGHVVKNVSCELPCLPGYSSKAHFTTHMGGIRGFFGNFDMNFGTVVVQNLFLQDIRCGWPLSSTTAAGAHHATGGISGGSPSEFIIRNCGVSGHVYGSQEDLIVPVGSIIGYAASGGIIESCYSVATVEGHNAGGMVGELGSDGSIANSFANPIIIAYQPTTGNNHSYSGGLVANLNGGSIKNCYVRLRGYCAPSSDKTAYFGLFVGKCNKASLQYVYAHKDQYGAPVQFRLIGNNTTITDYGLYGNTIPYKYSGDNNLLSSVVGSTTYAQVGKPLVDALNDWAIANGKTSWARTTSNINEDYPLLRFDAFNTVISPRYATGVGPVIASSFGVAMGYTYSAVSGTEGPTDELLDPFMFYKMGLDNAVDWANNATYAPNGAVIDLYFDEDLRGKGSVINFNDNTIQLYINEDVAVLHDFSLKAYVGITLDNSAGANGANPSASNAGGVTDVLDWHMFSTPLASNMAPLGIDYYGQNVNNTMYQYNYWNTPPDVLPQFGWLDEGDRTGNGYFPDDTPYGSYDYYCWTEPDYQWINFKRNGISHYHEDAPHNHIEYRAVPSASPNLNEDYLIPGKGYLLSIDKEQFMQSYGTLGQGDVTIPVTRQGAHLKGYNLLGNPYQSYLDFDAFAEENASLWETNVTKYSNSYILLDEDQKGYVSYTPGTSKGANAAPRYINMHQGFLILADNAGTATFTNDMRSIDQTPDFRGEGQPAYPLVNLRVTDANGNCENLVVEMNRPDCGGARKAKGLRMGKGQLYAHHEDGDYAIFFAREGMRQVPLYFETDVDDTFVLTWDIQNGQFHDLRLVDNITGANVDMSQNGQYVFQSSATDYKSRFKLVFDVTGLEEDEDGMASDSFAFVNNGLLVVNAEGQMDIVDLNGRVVYSSTLTSPQSVIDLNHLSHGLYVLKIAGQKSLMTQKIVF